uniref:PI-PLC X domain-containing protein 1 isoform X2 n=1 Tax=Ictidomys tridecemlineatus TaxID=43179 RepID=UPI001A9FE5C2|nr:PI-PLC X domain-containing protein 1 isoform X2 [Ictidomys tridecemlineatus]
MGGRVSASGSFRSVPCANANADWMSALCPRLWDVPLHHLSIPGSHDTMTYCLNKKSPVSHSESRLLQLLSKVVPCVTRPVVLRWSVTQALDITEQLDAGVRYLDLRIAHMLEGSEKNLHFVHMVYTTALVEDTLTEISEWLEQHPREVVILACRNFEGMTEDLHEYLVACIKNIFGDMLCPRGVRRVHCVQGLVCVPGLAGTSRSPGPSCFPVRGAGQLGRGGLWGRRAATPWSVSPTGHLQGLGALTWHPAGAQDTRRSPGGQRPAPVLTGVQRGCAPLQLLGVSCCGPGIPRLCAQHPLGQHGARVTGLGPGPCRVTRAAEETRRAVPNRSRVGAWSMGWGHRSPSAQPGVSCSSVLHPGQSLQGPS